MVKEIKDMTDQLSDFNSCVSEQSDSDTPENDEKKGWTTMNENRRNRRNKRRNSLTPNKEVFLKKANNALDPVW